MIPSDSDIPHMGIYQSAVCEMHMKKWPTTLYLDQHDKQQWRLGNNTDAHQKRNG